MPTTSSEELKDTQRGEAPSAPTSNKDALNPSCRIRNDQKWNSIKEEVYRIYITEDNTLRSTMRAVSEQHAFNASERKWKGKLKEWNFDKNISAHGMSIVLAKAQKRSKDEGKETAIFHGGVQITRERVEQFKRRKTAKDADAVSPSAETPANLSYHTPCSNHADTADTASELVVLDEDTIAALASNAASSAFRGLSGQPPSSQYFPAENQLSQALATIVETSSEDVLDYEEACENASSNSRLPDTLDDTESVRAPNSESSEPGSANLGLSSSHVDCSTIIDSSKKGCEISAMRIPSPNETLEGLPRDSQSPSLLQKSAILAEREAPLVEAIVGGYLNANGAMEYRIRPLPDSPDEQQSPASEFEAFTQNPSVNSDVGIPTLSTSDDSLQRSSGPSSSLAAAEKAVLEAMSLFKSDSSLETLSRQVEEEQIFLPEACKDLCDALNILANEYTNRNLLHQALIAVLIMEVNFKGFLKFPVAISTICLYNKARIFRKTGIFRLSEEAYRQAIDGCRSLGESRLRLRCQLHLGNLLRTLNRDTEALHLLIQTMVEQFRSENLSANKKRLARLIFSIKEMHSKMNEAGKMDEVVMIVRELFRLAMNPEPHPGCSIPIITAWSSIMQLGIAYSKLELFAIADLCFFGFGEPSVPHNFLYWMERARSRRGLCEHYQRQNKLSKGLEQLKMSFEAILPLAGTARYPKSFVDGLRLLLDQLKPNTGHMTTWTEFGLMRDWEAAERSCDQLVRLFVQSGGTDVREVRIELGGVPLRSRNSLSGISREISISSMSSTGSRFGLTYSAGSAASVVSNSAFMVP